MGTKLESRLPSKQFLTGDISRTVSRSPVVRSVTDGYGRGSLWGRLQKAVEARAEGMVPKILPDVGSSGANGSTVLVSHPVDR